MDVLGYCVYPNKVLLRRDNGYRFRRRLKSAAKKYARAEIALTDVSQSVAAWNGHCKHARASSLQQSVLNEVVFRKGDGSNADSACVAWRGLEQQTGEPPRREP